MSANKNRVTHTELQKIFDSFHKQRILIIGDVMVDHYLWGKVERISPEAPVPVVTFLREENRLGGAANVALNVHAMGAVPILCSVIGTDPPSFNFKTMMKEQGLSVEGILTDTDRLTSTKTRVIGGAQQLLRVDRETDRPLSDEMTVKLKDRIRYLTEQQNIDAILFQDYDKGVITPVLINEITALAKEKGIPTLVDPKKRNFNFPLTPAKQ